MTSAALAAARQRHQKALEEVHGDLVQIGSSSYHAAVYLAPVNRVMDDAGVWRSEQQLKISVSKSRLPTAPARGITITYRGIVYRLHGEMGGQNPRDPAWHLTASRQLPSPS